MSLIPYEMLHKLVSVFEDPVGLDRPLWRDYSRYQGVVNFDVAKLNGVLGMAARAGICYGYTDPFFQLNWDEAGRVGMYRTSYLVPYPDQPVVKQVDNWYRIHPLIDIIPRVVDLELKREQPWSKIADVSWEISELVFSRDGIRPIFYSRYGLINTWLSSWTEEMLNDHFWWLAQYRWVRSLEHAGPPTLPNGVRRDRVLLHQTADKKPGFTDEVDSKSVDWDRWEIGNEAEMHQFIAAAFGGDEPEPEPEVEKVRITADALNVRAEADASSEDLGELMKGSVVPVKRTQGDWKKIYGWVHKDWTEKV